MTYTDLQTLLTAAKSHPTPADFAKSHPTWDYTTLTQVWELTQPTPDNPTAHVMNVTHTDCPFWFHRYGMPKGTVEDWKRGKNKPTDYLLHLITADLLTDQSGVELTYNTMQRLITDAELCKSEEEFLVTTASTGYPKKLLKDTWELSQDYAVPTAMALTNTTRIAMHRRYDIPVRTIEGWTSRKYKPKDYILTFLAADLLATAYKD